MHVIILLEQSSGNKMASGDIIISHLYNLLLHKSINLHIS
jgi:hypothetical protein